MISVSDLVSTFNGLAPAGFAVLGFALGMRHATDPDHVIAVTAIVTRERRLGAATRTGLVWGLGHSLTVLIVGCAIIVLRIKVPVRLGLAMEFGVGVALILLGLPAAAALVTGVKARLGAADEPDLKVHSHVHSHGGATHSHAHVHDPDTAAAHQSHLFESDSVYRPAPRSALMSFGVGLVHGLAGSAAIALLVLGAIAKPLWGVAYLAVFCLGTIAGMMLITTAIGTPMVLAANRVGRLHRGLVLGSGLLSLCFGLFIAYQIGVNQGLFSAAPIWTPH
jgi:ABC-type nickel/cobalt efflux system permease component RcnA